MADEYLTVSGDPGVDTGWEVVSLVSGMAAGADRLAADAVTTTRPSGGRGVTFGRFGRE